jgi:hypothetical protein
VSTTKKKGGGFCLRKSYNTARKQSITPSAAYPSDNGFKAKTKRQLHLPFLDIHAFQRKNAGSM